MRASSKASRMLPATGDANKKMSRQANVHKTTMATLANVLVIWMVARSLSVSFSKEAMRSSLRIFFSAMEFMSEAESEKKAVSEAETKAETSSSAIAATMAVHAATEGVCMVASKAATEGCLYGRVEGGRHLA